MTRLSLLRNLAIPLAVLLPVGLVHALVTGTVVDDQGRPVAGARVRVSAGGSPPPTTLDVTRTNAQGQFEITDSPAGGGLLTVGGVGYLTLDGMVNSEGPYEIPVDPLFTADNPNYVWIKSISPDPNTTLGCDLCHGKQVEQWENSWHAQATRNPLVLDLYDGSGASGGAPGPSYRSDLPEQAGPCANCHAAVAAIDESTFFGVVPGTRVQFRITFQNDFHTGGTTAQVFIAAS